MLIHPKVLLYSCLLLSFFSSTTADAVDLFVSPDGNDSALGTTEAPLASLHGAVDRIRRLRKDRKVSGPVHVIVAEGSYEVRHPLLLLPHDSGTPHSPVYFKAAQGARPVFSGGKLISDWKVNADGHFVTQIPEVASGKWYFEQLYVNEQLATRARAPNMFYFYMQDVQETPLGKDAQKESRRHARAEQIVKVREEDYTHLATVGADALSDVQMMVYHKWDNTRRFISSIDASNQRIRTIGQGMKSWNPWKRGTRFILENFAGALDAPGEWFLSRDGLLTYIPKPGDSIKGFSAVAPVVERFISIEGDWENHKPVSHVYFQGLTFKHAHWNTPPEGFEAAQAASPIEGVVMLDGATNVTMEDCEFANFGTYGIWIRRGCKNCVVRKCHLHDFGAGGIRVGDTSMPKDESQKTHHNTIDNNIVRHGGRLFPCAVGIWIGHSSDNRITHNEIADLFYTGISSGWRWGYNQAECKRNFIAYNHAHHLGWGVLSDMGGIYTLGPSQGTKVIGNVFHDIYAYTYGGWGLYTDEGSTGIKFENNLVYRVKTGGFHQHYGRDNVVRNNIFAFSELHQLQATRAEKHRSFTFENNIVYYDSGKLLHGRWDELRYDSSKNCYWDTRGGPIDFAGRTLKQRQDKGHEQGSVIADPQFENPEQDDFRLAKSSPVFNLGFQLFDPSKAGVYGDADWIAKANDAVFAELHIAPPAPPLSLNDSFEEDFVGRPPRHGSSSTGDDQDAIVVTEETASDGKQSLVLVDSERMSKPFYPLYQITEIDYRGGRVLVSYDLRVDEKSVIDLDWRDYQTRAPYVTGPSLKIRGSKLIVPNGKSVPLPIDRWISFRIETSLEKGNVEGWIVDVMDGEETLISERGIPFRDKDFERINWLGFVSNARDSTRFFIDNIRAKVAQKPRQ